MTTRPGRGSRWGRSVGAARIAALLSGICALLAMRAGAEYGEVSGPAPASPAMFFTVTPCRLLDTRPGAPLSAGVPVPVQATGRCGIPAGASAVSLSPIAVDPTGDGYLQLYSGPTPPPTSVVNFRAGQPARAGNAIVTLDATGAFHALGAVSGNGQMDLVLDTAGYFFDVPRGIDDSYTTPRNTPLNVPAPGVLGNDLGAALSAVPFSGATPHGSVTLLANGSFTYTPSPSYFGTDSFPYTVQNQAGTSLATVQLGVTAAPSITSANTVTFPPTVFTSFTVTTTGYPTGASMVLTETGALPSGVTFTDNHDGTATISGTASGTGNFPIVITAANGIAPDATQNFTIQLCPAITVNNPATTTGTVNTAFSQTFTQSGAGTPTFTTSSTLPAGLSLSTAGVLSGTPTQSGSFPITVTVTDANGCTGTSPTYTLVIACQTITVTNPGVTTGTANSPFSQTFTAGNTVGTVTFTTSSTLPAGLNLSSAGILSGTPTQTGSFPIVVKATDANGCFGTGATYTLVIGCQTITVTNPGVASGTVSAAFSQTFTQSNAIGTATFTTASTLPAGLNLSAAGVLSGTPTQPGTFPIVVTVTDSNGCTGTGATYNLVIACQAIAVTNPATTTGTVGTPFSQTFTQSGAVGGATFTTASTLPTGLNLSTAGILAGTPTQSGSFPIVVTVTDGNGCTGTSATYTLVVGCQAITIGPAALPPGTSGVAYPSVTFTQTGGNGSVTFSQTGTLPTGMGFSVDTLSGTPTQTGSFPITIHALDANGCTASRDYLLVVACPGTAITLSPSSLPTVAANSPFPSTQFTASGGTGPYTFAKAGALPAGMNFSVDTLSGTPTQTGTFPITISATDSGGCAGSQDYVVTVTCNGVTITVSPGTLPGATIATAYAPVTFTASGGVGPYTFAEVGALPTGMGFSIDTLSGTPTQAGTFPITVTATDANGCTGATNYTLVVACQTITVSPPATATGTVDAAFSQTFTQTGANGTANFTTTSTLPTGMSLSSAGVLSGSPGQPGTFPIVVKVTDSNGCTGTSATYNLVISCQTITVTNPATTSGTVDAAFSQTFTQSGVGTHTPATFTTTSTLPGGLSLATNGTLSGTPTAPGTFNITVKVTDANGCTGTSANYQLVISCQTITVTKPAVTTGTYNTAFSQTFTQSGVGTHTPATFTTASTLPTGLGLATNGVLSGTPTQTGVFPMVVTVTDANGCTGTSSTYNLAIGPKLTAKAYTDVGNTQLVGGVSAPATPYVSVVAASNGDTSDTTITYATTVLPTHGTLTTFNSNGTFLYTPNAGNTTADSFTYTGTSNGVSATATATIAFNGMVWFVDNATASGTNDGRSNTPFKTMTAVGGAATNNGDFIYVAKGLGTTTGAYTMKPSQQLIGAGAALNVPTISPILTIAGVVANTPTLGGTVTLANSVTVNGIDMSTGASNAIAGSSVTGVTVTARNVTTTTGTAINLGGSGNTGTMSFTQVNANGAANGIAIQNYAGAFTVSGDGGGTSNGSGGTIQATTGHAITLANVSGAGVSLGYMNITNPGATGIQAAPVGWVFGTNPSGLGVNNFTLNHCSISDGAGDVTKDDGVRLENGTGTISITNTSITAARHQGITIDNFNQNIASLTIQSDTVSGTPGGDGILIQMRGTSVMTTGSIGGAPASLGNTISGNSATGLQVANADTGNIAALNIQNNAVTNNNAGIDLDLSQSSSMTVTAQNNTLTGQHTQVINMVQSTSSTAGTLSATIRNNTIGSSGVLDSGSQIGSGIRVANGAVNVNVTIDSNTIREVPNASGIELGAQAYTVTGNVKYKIVNNVVTRPTGSNLAVCGGAPAPCPAQQVFVLSDSNGVGGFDHVCTVITGNTIYDPTSWPNGAGQSAFYFARRTSASNTLQLEGTQANARAQILFTNTITNPGPSPTSSDVIDENTSGTVAIVAAGTCGSFPP
jgi:hypothetical protein